MDPVRFDSLTTSRSAPSTRRVVVGALLATAGPALGLTPQPAAAQSAKKRCKKIKGRFLHAGDCRCAIPSQSPNLNRFVCDHNPECRCSIAATGDGFCV